jgi:hypothetical protein
MSSTLKPRPREMSEEETAALAALLWVEGQGRVLFANALLHGKVEQVRLTLSRLKAIRDRAAQYSSARRSALN